MGWQELWDTVECSITCSKCGQVICGIQPDDALATEADKIGWQVNRDGEPLCPKCAPKKKGAKKKSKRN